MPDSGVLGFGAAGAALSAWPCCFWKRWDSWAEAAYSGR